MREKEQSSPQYQSQPNITGYYPIYSKPENNEIDLLDLISELWKKKWWIIGCVFLTTSIAAIYAFTAKEQWTATAVVNVPSFDRISNYYRGLNLVDKVDDKDIKPDDVAENLFNIFITQLHSYDERRKFIFESNYFKVLVENKNVNQIEKVLNEEIEKIKIFKNKENNFYTLSFSANTSILAKQILEDYLRKMNINVRDLQYTQLNKKVENRKYNLENQLNILKKISQEQRNEELSNIKMAMAVAEKTDINKPEIYGLTRIDNTNLFLLGKEALNAIYERMLIQPLVLNDRYYDLLKQYFDIESYESESNAIDVFSYLKSPSEPANKDSPKRLIIIILGIIAGAVVGCFIILCYLFFELGFKNLGHYKNILSDDNKSS